MSELMKPYYKGNNLSFGDLIAEKFTDEQISTIDEFQIYKYMWRWKSKNGIEDLKKALYYLNDLITAQERIKDRINKGNSTH